MIKTENEQNGIIIKLAFAVFIPTKHMISCKIGYNMEIYLHIILKVDKGSCVSRSSIH